MITGIVKGQELRLSSPAIVSDTIDYLEAVFTFTTADWDDYPAIYAHFEHGVSQYTVKLVSGAIGRDKHLNLSTGTWNVYLHGSDDNGSRITTTIANLVVLPCGFKNGDPLPLTPPSVAEQLIIRMNAVEQEQSHTEQRLDSLSSEVSHLSSASTVHYTITLYANATSWTLTENGAYQIIKEVPGASNYTVVRPIVRDVSLWTNNGLKVSTQNDTQLCITMTTLPDSDQTLHLYVERVESEGGEL